VVAVRVVETKHLLSLSVSLMMYCSDGAKEVEVGSLLVVKAYLQVHVALVLHPHMFTFFL